MTGQPRSVPELIGSWLQPAARMLRPGYWPAWWRSFRFAWPLSTRFLRRYAVRNLMVAVCLGPALALFLILASYHGQRVAEITSHTGVLLLPSDAVVVLRGPLDPGSPLPSLRDLEMVPFWLAKVQSRTGMLSLAGLPDQAMSRLDLLSGTLPASEGQALVSQTLADSAGLGHGDTVEIAFQGHTLTATVTGVTAAYSYAFDGLIMPLKTVSGLAGAGESQGNAYLAWDMLGRSVNRTAIARALPGAVTVVTPDLPRQAAARLVGRAHVQGQLLLTAVYLFAGLGVLNVMLLSYLQRRRYLGLLKAQGVKGHETAMVMLVEAGIMAATGTALGIAGGSAAIAVLNRSTSLYLELPWRSLPWAIALSLAVFYLGAMIPARMCRDATIHDLLYGRNLLG